MISRDPASLIQQDGQLLQIADAAFADSARRSGKFLICHPGCTQCCHGAFPINPLDALRLRVGMDHLAETNPSKAAEVEERARQYLAQYAHTFPGNPLTGILDETPEAVEAFADFANEAACPALDPASGLCDLYQARPMTCRVFGPPIRVQADQEPDSEDGLAVCELCFIAATPEDVIAAEMIVPHAEEQALLDQFTDPATQGDTIVAYCLIPPP